VKEILRSIASRIVVRSGCAAIGRRLANRDGAIILYGHRVCDNDEGFFQSLKPEWLNEHLAYLTRHYEIIPLNRLVDCLITGNKVPKNSVVLTFDDGFRDNMTNAFPILQKYNVPATIFVVTGSLTSGDLPWSQRLGFIFENTSVGSVRHHLLGPNEKQLDSDQARRAAYQQVKEQLVTSSRVTRDAVIDEFGKLLEVAAPKDRMLSWEDARELMHAGIEIGAHTFSHPLLARIDPQEAEWEMRKSRDDLLERLGIKRPSFCFPAGSWNPELLNNVKRFGFRCSFIPNRKIRVNMPDTVNEFTLSRIGFPNSPGTILEAEMDGPLHSLRNLWLRFSKT